MQKLVKGLTRLYENIARYLIWDVQVLHLLPFIIYFDLMLLFDTVMVEFLFLVHSSWFSQQIPACVSGLVQKILFFLTTKAFLTNFFVVVHHCGQGYAENKKTKLGCYLQGQGDNEGLYNQNMTVSTVFSELMILLQSNLAIVSSKNSGLLVNIVVTVAVNVKHFNKGLSGWYLLNCWNFVTKLCIVIHPHKLECHAKRLCCYLQGQHDCEGLYNQKMCVCIVSPSWLTGHKNPSLFLPSEHIIIISLT